MSYPLSRVEYGFEVEAKGKTPSLVSQVHGRAVVEVTGATHRDQLSATPPPADGVFTRESSLELHIFTADCLPLLFFTENGDGPIAAVHCGWRGAEREIVEETLGALGVPPNTLHVVLGPSIRPCCFEVKEDFIETFRSGGKDIHAFLQRRNGKIYFDLPGFVSEIQLKDVPKAQIHREANACTFCSPERLPSYRRNGGTDPRIKAWIRRT